MKPIGRRAFLTRSAAAIGAGAGGSPPQLAASAPATQRAGAPVRQRPREEWRVAQAGARRRSSRSTGAHQAGILTPRQAHATFVALDSVAPDRITLAQALQALSNRARELTSGGPSRCSRSTRRRGLRHPRSGQRPGRADRDDRLRRLAVRRPLRPRAPRPRELTAMPTFPNDDLDPARSHGDVLLQICAGQPDTVVHTLRELLRTGAGHRCSCAGCWTASRPRKRGPTPHNHRAQPLRASATAPPTRTRPTPR